MATVPPILLSIIICERVVVDRFSGMGYVLGITEAINAFQYPARHANMTFFAELTNGHGQVNCKIKLVDVKENDKAICEQQMPILFKDVKQTQHIVFGLQGFVFPHDGEFRFQLWAEEHLLGERRIVCRKIEIKKQGE